MTLRNACVVGVLAFAGSPLGPPANGQVPGLRRDGRWEVKLEMQMAATSLPPQTMTQCVTKEEAADPQKALPQTGRGANPTDCKITDYKVDGNKVTWSLACAREKTTGAGELLYVGETYTGFMKMNVQGQEMTMKYSGKRLGDCTK